MLLNHSNETSLVRGSLLLIAAGIIILSSAFTNADESAVQEGLPYERADLETIKMHTNQILSERNFAPNKTFMQWLAEKFLRSNLSKFKLGPWWGTFFLLFLTFWCILSLIAILIHFIYTLSIFFRSGGKFPGTRRSLDSKKVKDISFEELYKTAQELAGKKSFREAVSILMAALLRLLDSMKIISFHDSKTNGDYIRECPSDYVCVEEFRKFVLIFEKTIYGAFNSSHNTYQQLNSLMEHIRNYAKK